MRCSTDSIWPVSLRTGSTSPKEMTTVVACTTTWRIEAGRLVPAEAEQRWKPSEAPTRIAGVQLSGDLDYRRQDVALVVLGQAYAPQGRPITEMDLAVTCGRIQHRSHIIGDRRWEKSWMRLRIGAPTPFTSMPISNDRAFGGTAVTPHGPMPHAVNPQGRGFQMSADTVPDSLLPNFEDPTAPITSWTDRPVPSLWFKGTGGPAIINPPADPIEFTRAVGAAVLLDGPPALCGAVADLGNAIQLDGFAAAGPLTVPLPSPDAGWCSVQLGARRSRFPMQPTRIVVMPASAALVVTYAARFRWLMEPKDDRSVVVGWKE